MKAVVSRPRVLQPVRNVRPRSASPSVQKQVAVPRAGLLESVNDLANSAHLASKGVILFTMFYCSMNWMHYRRMREDSERCDQEKKNKK